MIIFERLHAGRLTSLEQAAQKNHALLNDKFPNIFSVIVSLGGQKSNKALRFVQPVSPNNESQ